MWEDFGGEASFYLAAIACAAGAVLAMIKLQENVTVNSKS